MKNILVFCPMRVSYPRAYGRSVTSVLQLEWDHPIEYMLRDGKRPHEENAVCISAQYNWAREHVLHNDYDFLMTIEADIVVPPDALKRLIECDSDVSYGLYVFRRGRMSWSAYDTVESIRGHSISETPDLARELWGQIIDVQGVGLGATLLTRKALETLGSFEPWTVAGYDCDWTLARRANELGLIQRSNLSVVCGHITQNPSLRILWPDPSAKTLFRIQYLDDTWFDIDDEGKIVIVMDMFGTTHVTKQQLAGAYASEKYRKATSEN